MKQANPRVQSEQRTHPSGLIPEKNQPQKIKISNTTTQILEKFSIAKEMNEKMNNVAHTSSQLRQISEAVINTIMIIQEGESNQEKQTLKEILSNASDIDKKRKLFYHHIKELFQKKMKDKTNDHQIKPETCSRIFNFIACFKQSQKIETEKNWFGVLVQKSHAYSKLSDQEMEEVIRLEALGQKVEHMGTRMKMKYDSIEKESENIMNLLANCLIKYVKDLLELKYDLNEKEVMRVADISREACNYHDNGVVILFIYLVQASLNLENQKEPVEQIQEKMEKAIKKISLKYPPGKGLDEEQKDLQQILQKLKYEDKFNHKLHKFESNKNRSECLEKIILEYAKQANNNKNDFEELVREACLTHAIQTKIGLKLYPNSPSDKAMLRIKEKMLFGKTKEKKKRQSIVENKQQKNSIEERLPPKQGNLNKPIERTVKETLDGEEESYKKNITQLLQNLKAVEFKISDMVRGKCVFLQINDIILTVQQIKAFVKQNAQRYRITEIESRFTKKPPISDVTLKIAINEKIVAELQLTIQANAAAYNFAHKIYQLQRTKVFSKLKIVHNYFEEFQGGFKELILKGIQLSKEKTKDLSNKEKSNVTQSIKKKNQGEQLTLQQKYFLISQKIEFLEKFMNLKETTVQSFAEAIEQNIQPAIKINKFPELKISTDKQVQAIVLPVFKMEMGSWQSQLGKCINQVIESKQPSNLLKQTLMYFFFKHFDLSKQVTPMLEFFGTYYSIVRKLGYDWQKYSRQSKDYTRIYLESIFQIKRPFEYGKYTPKSYYKSLQAKQFYIHRYNMDNPSKLVVKKFIDGDIIEQKSSEKKIIIKEFMDSFYVAIDESQVVLPQFRSFYQWLLRILEQSPELDSGFMECSAKFLNANLLLKDKKYKQAKIILNRISQVFKNKEEQEKQLQCQLLLAECQAGNQKKSFRIVKDYYLKRVVEKAKGLGLDLRGRIVANSEWRIYQLLWEKKKTEEDKKYLEQNHLKKALTESSRSQGKQFILKMLKAKDNGHDLLNSNGSFFTFHKNDNIKYIFFNEQDVFVQSEKLCQYLSSAKWPKLTTLYLARNSISDDGCQHLSKSEWPNLTDLFLDYNRIGAVGCQHLSEARWPHLNTLYLDSCSIGDHGCQYLSSAKWPKLTTLYLARNSISDDGCQHLSKSEWPNLTDLFLDYNRIGAVGCQYLSEARWPHLNKLFLKQNGIGAVGCKHLREANWPYISSLSLGSNKIGNDGCHHLSQAAWPNLKVIFLDCNEIDSVGCSYLRKAKWVNLEILNLGFNNLKDDGCIYLGEASWLNLHIILLSENQIGADGCHHLSKAEWPKLKQIDLDRNQMTYSGCQYLRKAEWVNLTTLNLDYSGITDDCCYPLKKANWPNLKKLLLGNNDISEHGISLLQQKYSKILLTF